MVDALTRIHAALAPGAVLVDTQPISLRLPVVLDDEPIGELEDDEWLEMVAAVDAELHKALAAGIFQIRHEERYSVVHEFGSGRECLEVVGAWGGTHVPSEIASRLERSAARATVEHDVRLRVLDRCVVA